MHPLITVSIISNHLGKAVLLLDDQVFFIQCFAMTVIPGAAERRPGIQNPSETFWIPAFAGMTQKLEY